MKKLKGLVLLLCCAFSLSAQQINKVSYFFDAIPTNGFGTSISISASDTVNQVFSIPTTGLSSGFHSLYVQTQATNGMRSLPQQSLIYILANATSSGATSQINRAEWFLDVDPGVGSATPISFTNSDSINTVVSLSMSGVNAGFHSFFIRVKNAAGHWSLHESNLIYVLPSPQTVVSHNLVAAEYFFDTDPGVGNGTPFTFNAADSIDQVFTISLAGLSLGAHDFYIRVKNSNGTYSLHQHTAINVCLPSATNLSVSACGAYTWPLNGITYTASGAYMDTLQNVQGCDSVITLNLMVNPIPEVMLFDSVCPGDTLTLPWGMAVTQAGVYTDTSTSVFGCDSITNIVVSLMPAPLFSINSSSSSICSGVHYEASGLDTTWNLTWSNGATSAATTYGLDTNVTTGVSLVATNALGCSAEASDSLMPHENLAAYTLLAKEMVYLRRGTQVVNGGIGANGNRLNSTVDVRAQGIQLSTSTGFLRANRVFGSVQNVPIMQSSANVSTPIMHPVQINDSAFANLFVGKNATRVIRQDSVNIRINSGSVVSIYSATIGQLILEAGATAILLHPNPKVKSIVMKDRRLAKGFAKLTVINGQQRLGIQQQMYVGRGAEINTAQDNVSISAGTMTNRPNILIMPGGLKPTEVNASIYAPRATVQVVDNGRANVNIVGRIVADEILINGKNTTINWNACQNLTPTPAMAQAKSAVKVELEKQEELSAFSVFPNPTNGLITITSDIASQEAIQIRITDLSGKTVLPNAILSGNQAKIDLSDLSSGMYLVHLSGSSLNLVQKISLQ